LLWRLFPQTRASVGLISTMGFREVGVYEKHGKLNGVWRDVVIVERLIPANLVYSPHMLLELTVENYAVVDRLRVGFHAGLNLLTGETGSGKSLVVDALGLLLGGRASADMIRSGEERARIAGIFDVRANDAVREVLDPAGFEAEDGDLLIE